ncbi:MAG TPA: GNAT family protein [Candidatus Limnocylindrales bacterium]
MTPTTTTAITTATTRLVTLDDAPALAHLLRIHRDFLAPWQPVRPDEYFTDAGQRAVLEAVLHEHRDGVTLPHVILVSGKVVGRVTLSGIARGPFLSARLGYWVAPTHGGRGVATTAVGDIARVAFEELGLHRLEAGTLLHNVPSQRVLERNGFVRFGIAQKFTKIAGEWQDHALYQLLAPSAP